MEIRKTYVCGHRNPDCDSVMSAVALADLRRRTGLAEVDIRLIGQLGRNGMEVATQEGLGVKEIDLAEVVLRMADTGRVRTQFGRESLEDTDALATLIAFEFADAVVGLHHLLGLYIDGLARGRLIVDDTAQFALVGGRNGQHETTLAKGGTDILIYYTVGLRLTENGLERTAHPALRMLELATDAGQFGRSTVFELAVLIEDSVDLLEQVAERDVAKGQLIVAGGD